MADVVHRYYCGYCFLFLYGLTAATLATNLNLHNTEHHPADCTKWTAAGIPQSAHYSLITSGEELRYTPPAPEPLALPRYTQPYGTREWGNAERPPHITADDLAMLKENHIKW